MTKVLYTSAEVRKAIIELFSSATGRRVAITAFVGDGAESFLPRPKGLHLICWPKAGGTNPNELRKLKQRGVLISFADAVHMKVYWAEDRGAVITSANLSINALGSGDLREAGVFLPPGELDIDRITYPLRPHPATEAELLKLDRLHKLYATRNRVNTASRKFSFSEWYDLPWRSTWKLGWWNCYGGAVSLRAKATSREEYGAVNPNNYIPAGPNDYSVGDWSLNFKLTEKSASQLEWMFVDFVVRVPRSDKKAYNSGYPYQAVQVWPLKRYPTPPFCIDKRFRLAFSEAVRKVGADRIKHSKSLVPSKRLIDMVRKYYG